MLAKSLKVALGAFVMAATLSAFSPAQAANLILDGDFANGNATFSTVGAGGTLGNDNAWIVTTGSVDLIGGYWQAPSAGGGSVDLDGNIPNVPGSILQIFTASAGLYKLSFSLSGNPDGAPTTKMLQVTVGGVSQSFSYAVGGGNSHANMLYAPESLTFTTGGGPVELAFTSLDISSPFGAVIGDVSVAAAPLPASFWMFASALIGFAAFFWNRSLRRTNIR